MLKQTPYFNIELSHDQKTVSFHANRAGLKQFLNQMATFENTSSLLSLKLTNPLRARVSVGLEKKALNSRDRVRYQAQYFNGQIRNSVFSELQIQKHFCESELTFRFAIVGKDLKLHVNKLGWGYFCEALQLMKRKKWFYICEANPRFQDPSKGSYYWLSSSGECKGQPVALECILMEFSSPPKLKVGGMYAYISGNPSALEQLSLHFFKFLGGKEKRCEVQEKWIPQGFSIVKVAKNTSETMFSLEHVDGRPYFFGNCAGLLQFSQALERIFLHNEHDHLVRSETGDMCNYGFGGSRFQKVYEIYLKSNFRDETYYDVDYQYNRRCSHGKAEDKYLSYLDLKLLRK